MPRRIPRPKAKIQKPRAKSGLKTSLGTKLQQSRLGSAMLKLKRDRQSKLKPKAKKSAPKYNLRLPRIKFLSPHLPGRLFWLQVGGVAVVVAVVLLLLRFGMTEFTRSKYDDPERASLVISGDTVNILVAVYDPGDRYSFVDMLGVLSIDKREDVPLHYLGVSPEFGVRIDGKQVKIRSVLAQIEAEGGYGVGVLMSLVGDMLGVRIDRYALFDKDDLASYLHDSGYSTLVTDEVDDPEAGVFHVGDVVQADRLVDYLAADSAGVDAQMLRVRTFVADLLARQFSVVGFARMYIELGDISSLLETDLSRGEILDLSLNLVNRVKVDSVGIATKQAVLVDSALGGYLSAITRLVDAEVGTLLTRNRVAREQARVEVFNATQTGGLASRMKRLLENQGTNVIRAANSPELSTKSKLYVSDIERFSANVVLVSEMLRGDVQVVEEDYPLNHTGDLVLVLGAENL